MSDYDVVVIGAGPGGYVAAIRCAQLGMKTACVEKWSDTEGKQLLGGTCLNVGCIPSKALLDSSHQFHNSTHLLPAHGISVQRPTIDIAAMQERKLQVVGNLTRGIGGLFRKNKIESLFGTGSINADRQVVVTKADGSTQTLNAKNVIIASGSVPVAIPPAAVDQNRVIDSEGALTFSEVPKRLGVIGAGVIGLELGSVWSRLGSEVTILEALPDFLATAERRIAADALKLFTKQGLDIKLGARVTGSSVTKTAVNVDYTDSDGEHRLKFDKLVVAVGRKPYTEGLGLDAVGITLDERGYIPVDASGRTTIEGIYAVGDCTPGPMLAHKASEEGIAIAETIAGQAGHSDHRTIPWVIYTHPEIAWVGQTEHELKAAGIPIRSGSFPYMALGRAQGAGETDGMVKIIGHGETDEILGVHILGANASELIAEAVSAMTYNASTEDLARTIHAHPTLSEALHEAALAVDKRAIHI